jgi:predicted CXXCH cytochrome family protein
VAVAAAQTLGCGAATRHEVLTFLFDGVPPLKTAEGPETKPQETQAGAGRSRSVGYGEHGPYAARLCGACHEAGATNALVAPKDALCVRCHAIKLDKKYVHGPLASGGCLACHDPHSSQYRYLLVSESDGFCLRCHDAEAMARIAAHEGVGESCTTCHDAHLSDTQYLLK